MKEDADADDIGNVNIEGVLIALLDGSNTVLATTLTNGSGDYALFNLTAGKYRVRETNLASYADATDIDGGDLNLILSTISLAVPIEVDTTLLMRGRARFLGLFSRII